MASGDTLLIYTPQMNEPPASAYATLDLRNQHPVLDFDASTNESAVFSGVMPQNYAATTGVTAYVHWCTASTTGDVDWDGQWERIGDQQLDIDADSFATAVSADNNAVPETSGNVDIISIAFTDSGQMDGVAAGEGFRFKLTRDATNDTAAGDAELRFLELRET